MILAGDIGGTKVNLGLFEAQGRRLKCLRESTRPSHAYARLQDLVAEFLAETKSMPIQRACFGVAGPVRNGRVQLTNLPWRIEAVELAEELKIGSVSLLNDLEANAWGVAELQPGDFHLLNPGDPRAAGNAAMISAGTGLGEAGFFQDGAHLRPFACEGGHSDFSPQTKLDAELWEYLAERFGRVSWEKVLSGQGLVNIYQFLRDTGRGEVSEAITAAMEKGDPGAVISQAGLEGASSRCAQALEMFVSYYGAEAGNLALKLMATGGVHVGGGIAPKILSCLTRGGFLNAFFNKGRMRTLLEAIPVRVVLNPKTALLGAAHYAAFALEGRKMEAVTKS